MLEAVPARTLDDWKRFFELEPFGEERADLRAGIVAAAVANCFRPRGARALRPQDFMPAFGRRPQTAEDQILMAAAITSALGGRDLRGASRSGLGPA